MEGWTIRPFKAVNATLIRYNWYDLLCLAATTCSRRPARPTTSGGSNRTPASKRCTRSSTGRVSVPCDLPSSRLPAGRGGNDGRSTPPVHGQHGGASANARAGHCAGGGVRQTSDPIARMVMGLGEVQRSGSQATKQASAKACLAACVGLQVHGGDDSRSHCSDKNGSISLNYGYSVPSPRASRRVSSNAVQLTWGRPSRSGKSPCGTTVKPAAWASATKSGAEM